MPVEQGSWGVSSVKRALRPAALAALLPAALALSGCPLQTFDTDPVPAGGKGIGGEGGIANQGGGAPLAGGGAGAGKGVRTSPPRLGDDFYVARQHTALFVPTELGLLSNDIPLNLRVDKVDNHDDERPREFDVELNMQDDGSFSFAAAGESRFFGIYRFRYRVKSADEQHFDVRANVQIRVMPTDIDLGVLQKGVGGFVIHGPEGSALGAAVERGTDIDRDGRRDLLLGAPGANGGDGAAFVVFGKTDASALQLELGAPAAEASHYVALHAGPLEGLGRAATWVGDVDGDGAAEAAIAASAGGGRVYLVSGAELAGSVDLRATARAVIVPDANYGDVGRIVRGVGDMDQDGFPDLLVSSKGLRAGALHVLRGGATLSGSVKIGSAALFVEGPDGEDGFPIACTGAGDVDADGATELFLSAESEFFLLRGGQAQLPRISRVTTDGRNGGWRAARTGSGASAVAALLDVNGDGNPDLGYCDDVAGAAVCSVVFGPPSVLAPSWTMSGFSGMSERVTISGGGDVDGDGLADILLSDSATAYVVFGKRAGHSPINLSELALSEGYRVSHAAGGEISSAAIVGDVNGDRIADLAFGDATADDGAGRVYVVFGVSSR